LINQVIVKLVDQGGFVITDRLQVKFREYILQQFNKINFGIEDKNCFDFISQLFKQGVQKRGFSYPDLPDNGNKASLFLDAVNHGGKRFLMTRAEIKKPGVRGQIERLFIKVEELGVHREQGSGVRVKKS